MLSTVYALFQAFAISYVDALLIIGLPNGPTAHFKLSNLVLRKDIKVCKLTITLLYIECRLVITELDVKCNCRITEILQAINQNWF